MKTYILNLIAIFALTALTATAQARLFATTWNDLTEGLTTQEESLSIEAIKGLKAYSMYSLIESHVQLENYLYCLSPKKKQEAIWHLAAQKTVAHLCFHLI